MIQLDHDEDIARANGVEDHRRQAQQEGALYRRPHTASRAGFRGAQPSSSASLKITSL